MDILYDALCAQIPVVDSYETHVKLKRKIGTVKITRIAMVLSKPLWDKFLKNEDSTRSLVFEHFRPALLKKVPKNKCIRVGNISAYPENGGSVKISMTLEEWESR